MKKTIVWNNNYYKRIVAFMFAFFLLIFLPFSFLSYRISKNKIISSIEEANKTVFAQMEYNFNHFSALTKNICLEIFLNSTVQQMLYNQELSYTEAYYYLGQLSATTLLTNSYIDSVIIYNHKNSEWFYTGSADLDTVTELSEFIDSHSAIPKLQPVLRKINVKMGGHTTSNIYVFSYFMYQSTDPSSKEESFLIVNENANWFVDNVTSIQQARTQGQAVYLVNEQEVIYSSSDDIKQEDEAAVLSEFWNKDFEKGEQQPYYISKSGKNKFIVSHMKLGAQSTYLLIVRNYKDVFSDLTKLQREYLTAVFIFLVISVLLLGFFSRSIYSPVQNLIKHVGEKLSTDNAASYNNDELAYLKNVLEYSSELNQKLILRSSKYEPMLEQFQLQSLAQNSTEENLVNFVNAMPEHWLSCFNGKSIAAAIVMIDNFDDNQFHFEASDMHILAFAVHNIVYDIMDGKLNFSHFYPDESSIYLVIEIPEALNNTEVLYKVFSEVQGLAKQHLDITLTVSHSSISQKLLDMQNLFKDAEEYLQYRYLYGPGMIINRQRCLVNLENRQTSYDNRLEKALIEQLAEKNMAAIKDSLDEIKSELQPLYYSNANICVFTLVNRIAAKLDAMYNEGIIENRIDVKKFYSLATNTEFIDICFSNIYNYISELAGANQLSLNSDGDKGNINAILEYVEDNFSDINLSSRSIGDHLGLSHRYVMYKFKEYTGVTLSDHIAGVRMRKAAHLLKNTGLSVIQVARQTGIDNEAYFYRLFKKTYNCTPREFSERFRIDA